MLNQVQHDKWMRNQYAESSSAGQVEGQNPCHPEPHELSPLNHTNCHPEPHELSP